MVRPISGNSGPLNSSHMTSLVPLSIGSSEKTRSPLNSPSGMLHPHTMRSAGVASRTSAGKARFGLTSE